MPPTHLHELPRHKTNQPYLVFGTLLTLFLLLVSINATSQTKSCPIESAKKNGRSLQQSPAPDNIKISADQVQSTLGGKTLLKGNVQFEQGNNSVRANTIAFDADKKIVYAKGDVQYTACGSDDPDWFLSAESFFLDGKEIAVQNTWLVFGGVKIFYLPYYRLPTNAESKTGLLSPQVQIDNESGFDLRVPIFFRLADNLDLTFTPRALTKRGLQLDNEIRYLSYFGESNLRGDWLNDRDYDSNRYSYSFYHHKEGKRARVQLLYQNVSDTDYIEDFKGTFRTQTENYLPNYAQLDYVADGWNFSLLANNFRKSDKNTTDEERPYKQVPSISLGKQFFGRLGHWNFATNYTQFKAPEADTERFDGKRFDSSLQWAFPMLTPGIQITPAVKLRYTQYSIDRPASLNDRNIRRTIPSFSLKSKLIFEKSQAGYKRTLEPEFYYHYVPHRNQDDIPLYDTITPDFQFNELFADNYFQGSDRIADTNQISVGLTHRILHSDSGKEVVRAQLGQIFYFQKRRVKLATQDDDAPSQSDTVGALSLTLNDKLTLRNALVWNHKMDKLYRVNNQLSLNAGDNRIINFFHRYKRGAYRQLGTELSLPVNDRWKFLAGASHDTLNKKNLSAMLGFEYQSCCWRFRILGQRYLKDLRNSTSLRDGLGDYDQSIGFEINFNNLATFDTDTNMTLQQRIDNYEPR